MRKAEAAGNNDCPVKIKLVAPPLYVLTTQTLDKVSSNGDMNYIFLVQPRDHSGDILGCQTEMVKKKLSCHDQRP